MDTTFQRAVALLKEFERPWAVCGGWGIDLFLGQKTREHKDLDITVKRHDQLHIQTFLRANEWMLQKVEDGKLQPWGNGNFLELPIHNVWCNHPDFPPDYLEVLFSETSETHFEFRRNRQIRLPLERAFITAATGIPILAPEIILLYRAKYSGEQPTYQQDFELVVSQLDSGQRSWLRQSLTDAYGGHAWVTWL